MHDTKDKPSAQHSTASVSGSGAQPTLRQVMLRPRWIGALILAIAVAGGFAWLGNWQLEAALVNQEVSQESAERVLPLNEITEPGTAVSDAAAGRVATVTGYFVSGDFGTVGNRVNSGEIGYWVVGHFVTEGPKPSSLSVALGWTSTSAEAEAVVTRLHTAGESVHTLEGRYSVPEGGTVPAADENPFDVLSMLPAQQANLWNAVDGPVYQGFLVSHESVLGLDPIDSFPPLPPQSVNWLNLFYAAEWIVFAGFAIYFWYRLTRDALEKEIDLLGQQSTPPRSARAADERVD
ncbi:SURF1 family cytochrome oxidase biogenesis protein [Lysinibacter sp. HNR]|uniref:SURF1 family protein n=1 Tax=Lysinibacter sp. HNR TaxID=3031408 RepID=UPI0024356FBC|nr:SURF1 family cytochrome oxidase biogenesis protein [Lysinibacter sp. HNR]WGD37998.1 SURF1 family cytochrome oxidase biogenesis protein [Lysinibacter sp. HNR]